ncbi:ABC transporter substrate-binding protein [Paenibacillus sp. MBLB4367]|uniref:ABC transporter substrate-binding protein n=1 Tax=Paenibacillus sp. MBLB4367 TaxID=3384767 RepID=UPI0039082CD9
MDLLLSPDKCYLLAPGDILQLENGYDSALRFYQITFTAIRTERTRHVSHNERLIQDRYELAAYPFNRLERLSEELYDGRNNRCDIEWFKQHMKFQELLGFLLEHNLHSEHLFNSTRSVESTIRYLQNHYMHNITVKQLAQLASVSQWQYTPIFQELTGKKPLDYLTELRINRSKELLLNSSEPLREIAKQVGFTDEYYYNRRFRQTTGTTPKQYARLMRRKNIVRDWTGHEIEIPVQPKRIIFHGETFGDLLALGIIPIGCASACLLGTVYEDHAELVQDVGFPINAERSGSLEPDLIIMANPDEAQYKQISKIAPTVTFNSFAPLDQRLYTLGDMLDKKQEAEKWLTAFNAKSAAMWQKLQTCVRPGETASVFIFVHGARLFVMGAVGFPSSLYHPHGFRPVDKIQELLDAGHGFIEILPSSLPVYAGDRIFMLMHDREDSSRAAHALMDSPLWQAMPAVQKGHVYLVDAAMWNSNDAMTREKLLDMLPGLLRKSS